MGKGMKLGQGGRFAALKSKLADRPGVTNPGALAAAIGRKKYGAEKMASMASAGRMKSHLPKGVPLSPMGDLAAHRQAEYDQFKGFKNGGPAVKVAGMFSGIGK